MNDLKNKNKNTKIYFLVVEAGSFFKKIFFIVKRFSVYQTRERGLLKIEYPERSWIFIRLCRHKNKIKNRCFLILFFSKH